MKDNILARLFPFALLLAPSLGCEKEAVSFIPDEKALSAPSDEPADANSKDEEVDAPMNGAGTVFSKRKRRKSKRFRKHIEDGSEKWYRPVAALVTGTLSGEYLSSGPGEVRTEDFTGEALLPLTAAPNYPDVKVRFSWREERRRRWRRNRRSNRETVVSHREGLRAGDNSFSVHVEQDSDFLDDEDYHETMERDFSRQASPVLSPPIRARGPRGRRLRRRGDQSPRRRPRPVDIDGFPQFFLR